MDLTSVKEIVRPRNRMEIPGWTADSAYVAGGTWLFSEPQPSVRRLIDLTLLEWPDIRVSDDELEIGAACTLARLYDWPAPARWPAAGLIRLCCEALLASFKIWHVATIGGNLCLALPAAPFAALAVALEGDCLVWTRSGGERTIRAAEFIRGPRETALAPGEILRAIRFPDRALRRRWAFRKASLTPGGLPAALLIGTCDATERFDLVLAAAVGRPVRCSFPSLPDAASLAQTLHAATPEGAFLDDGAGAADWRRAVSAYHAEQIRAELIAGARA